MISGAAYSNKFTTLYFNHIQFHIYGCSSFVPVYLLKESEIWSENDPKWEQPFLFIFLSGVMDIE